MKAKYVSGYELYQCVILLMLAGIMLFTWVVYTTQVDIEQQLMQLKEERKGNE